MPGKYYLVAGLERRGPYTREELEAQTLRRETLVWFKGLPDWVAAGQVSELLGIFEEPPPVPGSERAAVPREERPPIPERAAEPREERPPTLDREVAVSSEQFKDPDVTLPRAEIPSPTYRDEADDLPPPIALARVPYDVVGMRRLFLGGVLTYVPGVVLVLATGVSIAFLSLHGIDAHAPRFDPQRKEIVNVFDPGARSAETLLSIATVAAAVLGVIGLACGAACFFVLMYRAWRITEDGRTRPTPGRAVGLLFVPFFNVYWVWVGIWGLARNLNRFVRRYDLEAPTVSQPFGFAISLYSVMTYIPLPFAGLVPLGLNLLLLPLFMRSVYRAVAAICDDANRQRIANAPLERMLRQPNLRRPVSAHILSIVAMALAPIGVGLFVVGFCTNLVALRHYQRDARDLDVHRQAIDHMRGLGQLNPQDLNRVRSFQERANNLDATINHHWRENLILSSAALGAGVLVLAIAIALALVARMCATASADASPQAPPEWPATHGAGFLAKNARKPF